MHNTSYVPQYSAALSCPLTDDEWSVVAAHINDVSACCALASTNRTLRVVARRALRNDYEEDLCRLLDAMRIRCRTPLPVPLLLRYAHSNGAPTTLTPQLAATTRRLPSTARVVGPLLLIVLATTVAMRIR